MIGLVVVNVLQPGKGFTPPGETFHVDSATLNAGQSYVEKGHSLNIADHLLNIIPNTFLGAFVSGDLLQVLFIAILVAFAIAFMGERGRPVLKGIEYATQLFLWCHAYRADGGTSWRFRRDGIHGRQLRTCALHRLLFLMLGFYITAALFVVVVLGAIAWYSGFSIFRFLNYIRDELLLVLGTSSSEVALPGMIEKMQRLGCSQSTVGLVIPTGFSFNLDGTNIYMAMAAVFLAQATNTPLSIGHQISLLIVAMLTSKGASGVTGAGFITLAATLQSVPGIPIESLAILVGIDRFMSECRA